MFESVLVVEDGGVSCSRRWYGYVRSHVDVRELSGSNGSVVTTRRRVAQSLIIRCAVETC